MSAHTQTEDKTVEMHDVGQPRVFEPEEIARMDVPPEPQDSEHVTLVAIAAKSGVEKKGGTLRDAARVLYVSPDGNFATERVIPRAGARTPSKIPACIHVAKGHSKLGERSSAGFSGKAKRAVEAHSERLEVEA